VTESGTAALLVALGAPGAPAAAAMLLFGFFTHAVEIPTGGVAWLTWLTVRRWRVKEHTEPIAAAVDAAAVSQIPALTHPDMRLSGTGPAEG
jgi:hypothetical protein